MREPFSLRWFDYDLTASISFPGAYGGTDFDNRGQNGNPRTIQRTNNFLYLNLGGQVQFGALGFTVMADFLRYDVGAVAQPDASGLALVLGRIHAVAAYGLLGDQVVVGGGARIATVNIADQQDARGASIAMFGAAPEVGVVVKPNDVPWRLGATARAPVQADATNSGRADQNDVVRAGGRAVPRSMTQPWEVEVGAAFQLGPRPLNPRWIDPHEQEEALEAEIARRRGERAQARVEELARMPAQTDEERAARTARATELEREEQIARAHEQADLRDARARLYEQRKARYLNWPRQRVLLLASLLMTGPSDQAVALGGFLDQQRELVGRQLSLSPRFAAESEPVPNLLRLRAGIYVEPSRYEDGSNREHFTFGGDLRTFSWDLFGLVPETLIRVSAFLDLAPRYQNFGFGVGTWH